MALYVYRIADGGLVSWCPGDNDPVASDEELSAQGFAKITGLAALDDTHAWDTGQKNVVTVVSALRPKLVPTFNFILSFTAAENSAVRASTNPEVQHLLFALTVAPQIDLNSATIQNGVAYLVSLGFLTQDRATAILAGGQ